MLQKIGDSLKSQRWLQWLVLGSLILVFAAWGAYGIVDLNFGTSSLAAKADGEKISIEEANRAWQQQQMQLQQAFGGEIPEATRKQFQDNVLEGLIINRLLSERVRDLGYRVSDVQVARAIGEIPAFQIDGKLNKQAYVARLAAEGITTTAFETDMRRDLERTQVQNAVRVSDFLTMPEAQRLLALENEQRQVRYATFPADKFGATANVDDAAVQAYVAKHQADYMTTESARLAYAELRLEQLAAQVPASDEELRKLYEKNKARYVVGEKRRGRHILVQIADPKDDSAALKKAQELLAQAKGGADFAELARKNSQDAGSAAQGGDLGWAERSFFVGPFSDALFSMQQGEIRGPVKTQFGYHVLKLEGVQTSATKTFEQARGELEAEYRRDQAADAFGDRQEQLQSAAEKPGASFDAIAKEFGLVTAEVPQFERGQGGAPLGNDQNLQDVVFSDAVLNQGRVGGPVALGEDRLVIVKVLEHRKSAPKPLADIRNEVVAAIRKEQGTLAARAAADAAVKRVEAGEGFDDVAKSLGAVAEPAKYIGRGDPSAPAQIRELAFDVPKPAAKPVVRALTLESGGAALVAVTSVRPDPTAGSNPEALRQRAQQISTRQALGDVAAYIADLRDKAEVEKNPKAFD